MRCVRGGKGEEQRKILRDIKMSFLFQGEPDTPISLIIHTFTHGKNCTFFFLLIQLHTHTQS